MGRLWGIIQAHLDEYGVREAAFARRMGTIPQTINGWKHRGVRELPSRQLLDAVARETRTDYIDVLFAALDDAGYGPAEAGEDLFDGLGWEVTVREWLERREREHVVSRRSVSLDMPGGQGSPTPAGGRKGRAQRE